MMMMMMSMMMITLLQVIRMEADIDVIKCGNNVIEPYTANATLRMEERETLINNLRRRMGKQAEIPMGVNESYELADPEGQRRRASSIASHGSTTRPRRPSAFAAGFYDESPRAVTPHTTPALDAAERPKRHSAPVESPTTTHARQSREQSASEEFR